MVQQHRLSVDIPFFDSWEQVASHADDLYRNEKPKNHFEMSPFRNRDTLCKKVSTKPNQPKERIDIIEVSNESRKNGYVCLSSPHALDSSNTCLQECIKLKRQYQRGGAQIVREYQHHDFPHRAGFLWEAKRQ